MSSAFASAALAPFYAPDVKLRGTVATGLPYFSRETLTALARGSNPDAVTRTMVCTLLLLQLAVPEGSAAAEAHSQAN